MIIPVLNAEAYIEQQLSALAQQQTDVAWELILADNGCTDGTIGIVERLAPEFPVPLRVIDASARAGASAARNTAVAVAAGALLLFADADDVVDVRWVDELTRALRDHPFVGGKLEVHELNGDEVASWRMPLGVTELPSIGGRPCVIGCNFGASASALRAVGGFDETMQIGEDAYISLAMDEHGMPAQFAERAIVHYRYRGEPARAVRQMWAYGRCREPLYTRFGITPPTFLDTLVRCYRDIRSIAREGLRRRWPLGPLGDAAFVLGEASVIWRIQAFWHPVTRVVTLHNPVPVYCRRLGRLARLYSRARLSSRVAGGRR